MSARASDAAAVSPEIDDASDKVAAVNEHQQEQEQQLDVKQQPVARDSQRPVALTCEQLSEFVSKRVPEHKRVMCLIVRDKSSSSSATASRALPNAAKATSAAAAAYSFYPTYYLYIQAIVSTRDEASFVSAASAAAAAASDEQRSFSASSSLSGDMVIIGAHNAAASSNTQMVQRNSYSDDDNDELPNVSDDSGDVGNEMLRKVSGSSAGRSQAFRGTESKQPLQVDDLFDNDVNPYVGMNDVALAGRRRRKAKT